MSFIDETQFNGREDTLDGTSKLRLVNSFSSDSKKWHFAGNTVVSEFPKGSFDALQYQVEWQQNEKSQKGDLYLDTHTAVVTVDMDMGYLNIKFPGQIKAIDDTTRFLYEYIAINAMINFIQEVLYEELSLDEGLAYYAFTRGDDSLFISRKEDKLKFNWTTILHILQDYSNFRISELETVYKES